MLKYTNLRWSSAKQLGTPATDTTIPAQFILQTLKLVNFREKANKNTHHLPLHNLVAIYPTNVLTRSDPRTRQYPHIYSYRLIQTTNDSYKYSLCSKNNSTTEPPICSCCTMQYTRQFPRADPNICSRTTFQHLITTLVKPKGKTLLKFYLLFIFG